jgi:hypothetical protein
VRAISAPIGRIATCIRPRRGGAGALWQGGIKPLAERGPCVYEPTDVGAVALLAAEDAADARVHVAAPVLYRLPLVDAGSDLDFLPDLHDVAREMAEQIEYGQSVATLCYEGRNRSGLLSGLILWELGYDGRDAVRLIRERRKRQSLSTQAFADYLRSLVA